MYDIVIIGAGPAGMTAALYALRAGKTVLLLEKTAPGGQIIYSHKVENYPAMKQISGAEFAEALTEQITALGAKTEFASVSDIKRDGKNFTVVTHSESYQCKSVIIAAGLRHRRLGLENEEELIGSGVSFCAVCDGAFFRNQTVAVVGGGNTALQDALFLSAYCKKIYLIHRRDTFKGEARLLELICAKENIEIVTNSNVTQIKGKFEVEGIEVTEKSGNKRQLEIAGLFIAVGQIPENDAFKDVVELDDGGYIVAGEDCRTSAAGIFAAGDCRTKMVRQLTTAVADGACASIAACEFADEN